LLERKGRYVLWPIFNTVKHDTNLTIFKHLTIIMNGRIFDRRNNDLLRINLATGVALECSFVACGHLTFVDNRSSEGDTLY